MLQMLILSGGMGQVLKTENGLVEWEDKPDCPEALLIKRFSTGKPLPGVKCEPVNVTLAV